MRRGLLSLFRKFLRAKPGPEAARRRRRHLALQLETLDDRTLLAAFTAGDLVIYRVGSGTGSLVNTGNPVFLDEYTPAGTLVQSVALPTTASGAQKQLIASGTATSEGLLTRSTDGQYLVLTGYAADLGGAVNLPTSTSAKINRTVGRVSFAGSIDTSSAFTDVASGSNPRGAIST